MTRFAPPHRGVSECYFGMENRLNAGAATIELNTPVPGPTEAIVPRLRGVSETQLAAAYAACRDITRERARNFYYGLRLTPEPRRSAIYSIYAWMRSADDEADAHAPAARRHAALRAFRDRTDAILRGEPIPADSAPFWTAFAATVQSYPVQPYIFRDMLDGLDEDLETVGYRTDEQLSRYCYRVAGTAGLACVWIWGLRNGVDAAHAQDLALRRGQAFQRTNILRDFAQDFDETPSRVYIPADAFAEHRVTPADVRAWAHPDRCAALVLRQAAITREHYRASEELQSLIDPGCAPTLWAMTRIYSGLLALIEQDPSRVSGNRRIRLPGARKASIAISAALWARVGRW